MKKICSMQSLIVTVACASVAMILNGCQTTVTQPEPGTGTLWGYVSLLPRDGVKPNQSGGSGYGDRRMRDVEFVDYTSPEFAVVHLHGNTVVNNVAYLELTQSRFGPRFDKTYSVAGIDGSIVIKNSDTNAHTFSSPNLGILRRIKSGESATFTPKMVGESSIHVVDLRNINTLVYTVDGSFAVTSNQGRWELPNLRPGQKEISVWHPRFPISSRKVEVIEGSVQQIDIQVGVTASSGH